MSNEKEKGIMIAGSGEGRIARHIMLSSLPDSVSVVETKDDKPDFTEYAKEAMEVIKILDRGKAFDYENQSPKKWRNCVNIPVGSEKKQGRNELCACGSGKKFKKCCLK